eukprot:15452-Heterococcus_DN1.PRE.3
MLLSNNRYSYHTTLVALSKEQQFDKAFEVFAAMKEDGVLPDATVYRQLLTRPHVDCAVTSLHSLLLLYTKQHYAESVLKSWHVATSYCTTQRGTHTSLTLAALAPAAAQ